jgi:hypothetical protein
MALSTNKQGTFNGTLDVTAVEARLTDIQHATKELYCYITFGSGGLKRFLEGETWGKDTFKTKTYTGGGQNPVWNERSTFSLKNMTMDSHLNIKIYEKEYIKDDYLGVAKVDIAELLKHDGQGTHFYPLHEKGIFGYGEKEKTVGDVGIAVKFNCTEWPCEAGDFKTQVSDTITRGQEAMQGEQQTTSNSTQGFPSSQQITNKSDSTFPSTTNKSDSTFPLTTNKSDSTFPSTTNKSDSTFPSTHKSDSTFSSTTGTQESGVGHDPLAREGGHTLEAQGTQGVQYM